MRMRLPVLGRIVLVVAAATMLTGCGAQSVSCDNDDATSTTTDLVRKQLETAVAKAMQSDDDAKPAPLSEIRAAIAQLVLSIADIRTTKKDPDSTKRFCTGTLKLRIPGDMLDDADQARSAAGLNSVSDLADADDVTRNADTFTTDIDYDVQPTDDGSKVYAETDANGEMTGFAGEVIASALLRHAIEDAKRAQQQATDQQNAEQQAALDAQHQADLTSAQTDDQLASQTILATWKAIPDAVRQQLLPQQCAWIAKKNADCRVEAASSSTDPGQQEIARLQCDTRTTQARIDALNPYRQQGADATPLAPPPDADATTNDL